MTTLIVKVDNQHNAKKIKSALEMFKGVESVMGEIDENWLKLSENTLSKEWNSAEDDIWDNIEVKK
jgi:cell division protein FtsX